MSITTLHFLIIFLSFTITFGNSELIRIEKGDIQKLKTTKKLLEPEEIRDEKKEILRGDNDGEIDEEDDEDEDDEEDDDEANSSRGTDKERREEKGNKGPKIWDQWGKWSPCSVTCGIGKIIRWRHCVGGGCAAGEKEAQIKTCTLPAC
ncbi:isthmin-2-like [Onthophagus taurus]|uniref:isthmin-2-like n=1 Tax=Onthophagus taurus TaxID=166361 RepID=UPI000C20E497|nr:isthmin-2-like [Onthophagus taurus]